MYMYTCKHNRKHSLYFSFTQNRKTEVTNLYINTSNKYLDVGGFFYLPAIPFKLIGLETCNFCFPKCRDLYFGHGYNQC